MFLVKNFEMHFKETPNNNPVLFDYFCLGAVLMIDLLVIRPCVLFL